MSSENYQYQNRVYKYKENKLTINSYFKEITNKIKRPVDNILTIKDLNKRHEDTGWNYREYKKKYHKVTPMEDWLLYTQTIFYELELIEKDFPERIKPFIKENKNFAAILGNWLLNTHLKNYNKTTWIAPGLLILYSPEHAFGHWYLTEVYKLIRQATVNIEPCGVPLGPKPITETSYGDFKSLLGNWGLNWKLLSYAWPDRDDFIKDIKSCCFFNQDYFNLKYPLIISTYDFWQGDLAAEGLSINTFNLERE